MRRHFSPPLAKVDLDGSLGVDWIPLVRIDSNAEQARVGLDKIVMMMIMIFMNVALHRSVWPGSETSGYGGQRLH